MELQTPKQFELTEKAIQTHAFSHRALKDYVLLLESLLQVKAAAAKANQEAGYLTEIQKDAIVLACETLQMPEYRDLFQADAFQGGGGIAIHTNINEAIHVLTAEEGIVLDIKKQINLSQSTADVLHTASSIALFKLGKQCVLALRNISQTLLQKAKQYEGVKTMARTCLRDAMPAPLSELFKGYALVTERNAKALEERVGSLQEVNLGGTVIGSGEGASSEYRETVIKSLNETTGLSLTRRENLFDAAQNIDRFTSLSAVLSQTAAAWIKISKDLRLMGSGPATGLNEITLPEAIPGSSFFSGKVNPTLPETVLQACYLVLGNHRSVQAAEEHGELYLNVFESLAVLKTYESLELMTVALEKLNQYCLKNLKVNEESCKRWIEQWEEKQNA